MLRLQKHNDYIKIYLTFFILYRCAFCRFILFFSIYLLQREMKKRL